MNVAGGKGDNAAEKERGGRGVADKGEDGELEEEKGGGDGEAAVGLAGWIHTLFANSDRVARDRCAGGFRRHPLTPCTPPYICNAHSTPPHPPHLTPPHPTPTPPHPPPPTTRKHALQYIRLLNCFGVFMPTFPFSCMHEQGGAVRGDRLRA